MTDLHRINSTSEGPMINDGNQIFIINMFHNHKNKKNLERRVVWPCNETYYFIAYISGK